MKPRHITVARRVQDEVDLFFQHRSASTYPCVGNQPMRPVTIHVSELEGCRLTVSRSYMPPRVDHLLI
eukprot:Skav229594  [mRNA]  locus=scaffold510:187916:188119:- [translate_table: standard]